MLYRFSNKVLFNHPSSNKVLEKFVPSKKILFIPNPCMLKGKVSLKNKTKIEKLIGIPAPFPLAIKNKLVNKTLLFLNNLLIKVFRGFFSYEILAIIKPKKTIEELIQSAEEK